MAVSVVLIRVLIEACAQAGVPADRLFSAAEFDARRAEDTEGRVSVQEHERVQAAAVELTGDPALGLHVGERSNFSGFDVGAGLVAFAPTLREALQTYLRFQRIFGEYGGQFGSTVTESGDSATLRCEFERAGARYNCYRAELSTAGFVRLIRYFCADAQLEAVCFEHSTPPYLAEYTRIFGGAERFDQAFTGLVFSRALLDRGPLHKDPDFYAALEMLANKKLVRLEGSAGVKAKVVQYLAAAARGRRPDMGEVAKNLGMSSRSLRRRLTEEGVTYAQACDEALTQIAKNVLSDPRESIVSAALTLGFSDAAAFHRAFKRWTGMTPKQYRERV